MRSVFALALAGALASPAAAQDRATQYRELSLADGRRVVVSIIATEPVGIRVGLPQGEMLVPFDMLANMSTSDEASYTSQPPWPVYLHVSPAVDAEAAGLFRAIAGLDVATVGDVGAGVDATAAEAAASCRGDVTCITDHVPPLTWVVTVLPGETGTDLIGIVAGTRTRSILRELETSDDALWTGIHELFGLEVTGDAPNVRRARNTGGGSGGRSAFVPVPGFPAFGESPGQVAASWAIALPATALWVGAVGGAVQSPAEHVALGLVGFYTLTVVTNHAVARPRGPAIAVHPTEGGGAAVQVHMGRR